MTWEYAYDDSEDETKIFYGGAIQGTVSGRIDEWRDGLPMGDARQVVADAIQTDTLNTVQMQYELNYGFSERSDEL